MSNTVANKIEARKEGAISSPAIAMQQRS